MAIDKAIDKETVTVVREEMQDYVQQIENEQFENQAGFLNDFQPWHDLKNLLEKEI